MRFIHTYPVFSFIRFGVLAVGLLAFVHVRATEPESVRQTIMRAALEGSAGQQRQIIASLMGQNDEVIRTLFTAWREDRLVFYTAPDGTRTLVVVFGEKDASGAQAAERADNGQPLVSADGQPVRLVAKESKPVEHTSSLRRTMDSVLDMVDFGSADPGRRLKVIQKFTRAQNLEKLPAMQQRLQVETDGKVKAFLPEAIAIIQLKDPSDDVKLAAIKWLQQNPSILCESYLAETLKSAETAGKQPVATAAKLALGAVDTHKTAVNTYGTLFRGLSAYSILIMVVIGLAITFGLMGVINMAHGEMIAVGAYTTYIVQNVFGGGLALSPFGLSLKIPGLGLNPEGGAFASYFIVALPLSFLTAALVGIAIERCVIRFLYRRPLESLLATYGVSLIMQQVFKLTFGSNNVNVSKTSYLSGLLTINDVDLAAYRIFAIGFSLLVVFGTWLVLTKTPLGLLIRAVMQNRNMASCMGVRTERVNMLTFGLGCGLAGLAGAIISQTGNVGPYLGNSYIIESFMTVVIGGVGNLVGTVLSALGIGFIDQTLQQVTGDPINGKIYMLIGVILFLQWRPSGIFVSRSRSLDE